MRLIVWHMVRPSCWGSRDQGPLFTRIIILLCATPVRTPMLATTWCNASFLPFLLFHFLSLRTLNTGGSSCSKGDDDSSLTGDDGEVIAVLTLTRSWAKIKHPFSLELTGSALSGALGERWTLMVVITVIRLCMLNSHDRASKTSISVGEKLRAKYFDG